MAMKNEKYVLIFFLALWVIIFAGILLYEKGYIFNQIAIEASEDIQSDIVIPEINGNLEPEIESGDLGLQELFEFEDVRLELDNQTNIESVIDTGCGDFNCYGGPEFLDAYNLFERSVALRFVREPIYDIPEVDDYIRQKAQDRGYRRRGFANTEDIISFEGVMTRVDVRNAYRAMRDELLTLDIRLHFVSGYRSAESQKDIFLGKMNLSVPSEIPTGIHDELLDTVLRRSALPGYSKHHSGYAVDFGCGNDYLVYQFAETNCYEWMSENNFENAKRFGFIPSYPDGVVDQGPNPEPWEFVYVGEEYLK